MSRNPINYTGSSVNRDTSSHTEYRIILLSVQHASSILPIRSRATREFTPPQPRRLRVNWNASSLTRYVTVQTFRISARDRSRSRSSFQNGGAIGERQHNLRALWRPRVFSSPIYLSTAVVLKFLKSESSCRLSYPTVGSSRFQRSGI